MQITLNFATTFIEHRHHDKGPNFNMHSKDGEQRPHWIKENINNNTESNHCKLDNQFSNPWSLTVHQTIWGWVSYSSAYTPCMQKCRNINPDKRFQKHTRNTNIQNTWWLKSSKNVKKLKQPTSTMEYDLPPKFIPYLELRHGVSLKRAEWLYSWGQVELTFLHLCMHLHAGLSARGPSIADKVLLCRPDICQELQHKKHTKQYYIAHIHRHCEPICKHRRQFNCGFSENVPSWEHQDVRNLGLRICCVTDLWFLGMVQNKPHWPSILLCETLCKPNGYQVANKTWLAFVSLTIPNLTYVQHWNNSCL